ncbi:MAG: sodium:proton antiporter NhaD [Candidatus Paceibacterota bacterium]
MDLQNIIILVFILGYLCIIFEHSLKLNKTPISLLGAGLIWALYSLLSGDLKEVGKELTHHLGSHSEIIFFLIGAMAIVEIVDAHNGFRIIKNLIKTKSKRKLLWIISILAFFLSAALDNLTTTIVMVTILRKLIPNKLERLIFVGMVVICANAGGAWSPIGDVTTTMLWIDGQVSAANIMKTLILPSIVNALVPLIFLSLSLHGNIEQSHKEESVDSLKNIIHGNIMFIFGILGLIFVPFFKKFTHLPPYLGIMVSLGIVWIISERLDSKKDDADIKKDSIGHALAKVDLKSALFFLGILLMVSGLESIAILKAVAVWLNQTIGNQDIIVSIIGVLSAIIDNVPLVAASQGMYSLEEFPMDHKIWEFIAYAAGTGGSMLIIGSAAGVAAMGMEKISFM